jgi:hypothetical protein
VKIETWVAEQRLAQGKPRKISDRKVLDEIKSIIGDLPPNDEPAEKRIAS